MNVKHQTTKIEFVQLKSFASIDTIFKMFGCTNNFISIALS